MRALLTSLLAMFLLLGVVAGADGRPLTLEWFTFNEVGLDGHKRVLSKHNIFPEESSYSARRRQLAYVPYLYDGARSNKLWVADVDRSRERLLFESPNWITGVAWAPNGESIAFVSAGIWLIEPDGTNLRRVGESGVFPVWSPDSSQIAYRVSEGTSGSLIRILSLASGSTRDLVQGQNFRWSPDGTRLAYEHLGGGTCRIQIRIVTIRSGAQRAVACGLVPNWSPDGRRIAFARFGATSSSGSLWVVQARAGKPRRLARQYLLPDDYWTATWSEDSKWIAFQRGARYCHSRLSVIHVGSGRSRRLASHSRIVTPLAWSSTSRKVLYSGQRCSDQ